MPTFEKHGHDELLPRQIKELGLKLEGSPVEAYVLQLYKELEAKGLNHFRPACYLTDEWGCPSEEPVIGIPFYLADRRLRAIESAMNDVEDDREIMMYLRHEAGHAFNYAYEFYKTDDWRDMFGPFRRAYLDEYQFVPFSRAFVRHIAGWYAQKHPDEDFAETFAVWLTPRSNWREKYKGWGALKKLRYLDRLAHDVADLPPVRALGEIDFTVEQMEETIEEFYRQNVTDESEEIAQLALDTDLVDIFHPREDQTDEQIRPAEQLINEHRKQLVDKVAYWTGVRRTLVKSLVDAIVTRVEELGLVAEREKQRTHMLELTVYVTSLATTYLSKGKFNQ
ncbi:MAG TPA: putative zinc-binding metallopeptidase [Thermoanaerobaculia bacterium]|nr:putative zinc-binding metallopeptidase [Thermoanaerobaculia bacterium]